MRRPSILRFGAIAACSAFVVPAITAQNSIRIFDPVNVRVSATGTGFGSSAVTFNSATLNLSCGTSPITAVLSSSADGTGNILVDNNLQVTITADSMSGSPVNVCRGGVSDETPSGPSQNCFTSTYQQAANQGKLTSQNPDTFVSTGGVAPIDISNHLIPGSFALKIDLVDTGGYLAGSTVYLNTNCTKTGVTGPATITGNSISQTNPTPAQLTQNFAFNPTTDQQVQFVYDLSKANAGRNLVHYSRYDPGNRRSAHRSDYLPNGSSQKHLVCDLHVPCSLWRNNQRPASLQDVHTGMHDRHRQGRERCAMPDFLLAQ